jgi:hypothetical protein
MKTIHAINDECLANGSFYIKVTGPSGRTLLISHYILGDFNGWKELLPPELKAYSVKEAKAISRSHPLSCIRVR